MTGFGQFSCRRQAASFAKYRREGIIEGLRSGGKSAPEPIVDARFAGLLGLSAEGRS